MTAHLEPPPGAFASQLPPQSAPPPVPIPREALDYPVLYRPEPAVARWADLKRARTSRFISLGFGIVIWGVWYYFSRDNLWPGFWWFVGISLGISVLLLVWSFVQVRRAKREIDALHEGLALGVGRGGLWLDERYVPWGDVTAITGQVGKLGGPDRLVVETSSGKTTLPLPYLATSPAGLDGAVRALTGGRRWVNLNALDE